MEIKERTINTNGRMTNTEVRTSNSNGRMTNTEVRTSNSNGRMTNTEERTTNKNRRTNNIEEKKLRITRIMLNLLNIAPVIGTAVFTVLFSFVLTDRLEERILHSATTFFLWIFASMLYIMILSHFKELKKLILSAAGMIALS